MQNTHKKIVAVLFLFFVFLVGILAMLRSGRHFTKPLFVQLAAAITSVDQSKTTLANTDISQTSTSNSPKTQFRNETLLHGETVNHFFDFVNNVINEIEARFNEEIPSRRSFIVLHAFVQRLLEQKLVDDVEVTRSIILDSHNRLHYALSKIENKTVDKWADAMIDFHAFVASRNIPFLYVQVPDKEPPNTKDFPRGITKNTNSQMDNLLNQLAEKHVPYMDMRKEIDKDNLDWYSIHYRTDHHWRVETAFWAHAKIIERLNTDYHFNLDPQGIYRDLNNYDRFSLPFLGSQGRRVGPYFAGTDDFSYFLPRFETQMSISTILHDGSTKEITGNFFDSVCITEHLQVPTHRGANRYAVYFGGCYPLTQIFNPQGEKKILIIQDSSGMPFSAFLALSTQELDIIDLRFFTGSLREFIAQQHYDCIIALYGEFILEYENDLADQFYD